MLTVESLDLQITQYCTYECDHCMKGCREKKWMSRKTMENIFFQIKEVDFLLITGGEPLLAVISLLNLIDILLTRKIKVNQIQIVTNGTCFNDTIRNILKALNYICGNNLTIGISDDWFHNKEFDKLSLDKQQQVRNNIKEMEKIAKINKSYIVDSIYPVGRAANLNIRKSYGNNSNGNPLKILTKEVTSYIYKNRSVYELPVLQGNMVINYLPITVDGLITGSEIPFTLERVYPYGNVNEESIPTILKRMREQTFSPIPLNAENVFVKLYNEITGEVMSMNVLKRLLYKLSHIENLVIDGGLAIFCIEHWQEIYDLMTSGQLSIETITIIGKHPKSQNLYAPLDEDTEIALNSATIPNFLKEILQNINDLYEGSIDFEDTLYTRVYDLPVLDGIDISGDFIVDVNGDVKNSTENGMTIGNLNNVSIDNICKKCELFHSPTISINL